MVSIGRLPEKERRRARRINHIARDLRTPKYQKRVVASKKNYNNNWEDYDDNYDY